MIRKLSITVVTLVLLLALYTGAYLILFHTRTGADIRLYSDDPDPFSDPAWPRFVRAVFRPAIHAEIELVHLPKFRRYATGRWYPVDTTVAPGAPDDFIDIGPDGACTFKLGPFAGGGTVEFERSYMLFSLQFGSGHEAYRLHFLPHSNSAAAAPKSADVRIFPLEDPFGLEVYEAGLTTTAPPK